MTTVIFNNLPFGDGQQLPGAVEKVKGSNAFESLLHPSAVNSTHVGATKASFEVVSNVNEQKAFATHVLSYVDVVSVRSEKNTKVDSANLTKIYGSLSTHESATAVNVESSLENVSLLLPEQEARRALNSQKDGRANRLIPVFFSKLYEKIKVSIFGVNEKTVFIRDYYTNDNYSSKDFKLGGSDNALPIKKLFHNGLEK